ncbi:diguanylate cyclase (GGDEF)-like protein [Fontibacillus phaseoli]|uniref:Diguanylate cyclase (GGDEF)-like protein n=1 Tax=Fontibacillus phaseoli TaxID=1416533 RepID=A0A369B5J6_9BACL|nr:EAL domain-containing protein [Fontibacillus phaseoli]RCX16711.1 diguanylate cyclase (GGDEF)-like protein [Fontibacillus phaseoli]
MTQKRYSSLLLPAVFLAGLALALFCEYHELHLIFGLSLTFTNIALLLLIRCYGIAYGLSAATFVYAVSIFLWDKPYFQVISLLELVALGLLMRWTKRDRMFLADGLFWLLIGCPVILVVYYSTYHAITIELGLMIMISAANGLFNVLFADILLRYLPKRQFKRGTSLQQSPLYFSKVLFHIMIISIALPFLFYIVNNSWNTYASVTNYSLQLASNTGRSFSEEIRNWDPNTLTHALAPNTSEAGELQNLTRRYASDNQYRLIITGPEGDVIADSGNGGDAAALAGSVPARSDYVIRDNFFLSMAVKTQRILPDREWHDANYIYNADLSPLPLRLTILIPMQQYQQQIYKQYLGQFMLVLLFFFCAAVAGHIMNRRLLQSLTQLTELTTNLPGKLFSENKTDWPKSRIYEIRSLIRNFREMSNKLVHMIQDSQQNNLLLKEQTNRLQHSEKKLHSLAYYDELTGLPNRLHFLEYTKSLNLDNPDSNLPFAVMFADLNRFKQVNDTLGHTVGDRLLRKVARRFSGIVSEQCKVFRLSGDEFLFVLHYEDISDVQRIAQHICDCLDEPFDINGRSLYMSVSIGISVFPFDGGEMDIIMRNADIAMYVAKEQGDGFYHFYDSLIENQRAENMQLENDLKSALHGEQFTLYYQPKIGAESGDVIGAEALIRWMHPEYGVVSPAKFIPLAENSGIILDIDEWVLREACRQNKVWQSQGLAKFPVAVNISARHFFQSNLVPLITRVLNETGLEPEWLVLEITEGTLIRNVEYGVQIMEDLRKMGIHISMDDFGTGYSSLSQLDRLPISEMKLDRSFIQGLMDDSKKSSIVRAVIELGHHMDLRVVAEGIESPDELNYLTELECDQFQGYYFSKPLPSTEFSKFVQHWDGSMLAN